MGLEKPAHLAQDVAPTAVQHHIEVADDVSLPLVGLRNREGLGALRLGDLLVDVRLIPVVQRLAAPERQEHLSVVGLILIGDVERVLRARREHVELVVDPVRGHLGRDHAGARLGGAVTGKQIVVIDNDLVVLEQVAQGLRATDDNRLSLRLLIALHVEPSALERNDAIFGKEAVLDGLGTWGEHGFPPWDWANPN